MKDFPKKIKPTLESLMAEQKVITGKDLAGREKEVEKQKFLMQEAIEFEQRNRRRK